jgi:hypothetical protein
MTFKEELQEITKSYTPPKIDEVKGKLKLVARQGLRIAQLDNSYYDYHTIHWLRSEGFSVEETMGQRVGSYITVKW